MRDLVVKIFVRFGLYNSIVGIINKIKSKKQTRLIEKYGLEMLENAETAFDEVGAQAFLIFGSLLGAYRDKGFIPYDPDIDLGVLAEQVPENINDVLATYGFKLIRSNYLDDTDKTVFESTFQYRGINMDVFFFFREGNDFYGIYQHRHETKEWKEANRTDGFPCSYCYVTACDFEKRDFLGLNVWMPVNTDCWLREIYSDSYMTPVREWDPDAGYVTREFRAKIRSYRQYPCH